MGNNKTEGCSKNNKWEHGQLHDGKKITCMSKQLIIPLNSIKLGNLLQ